MESYERVTDEGYFFRSWPGFGYDLMRIRELLVRIWQKKQRENVIFDIFDLAKEFLRTISTF